MNLLYCKKLKIDDGCEVDLSGGCHGKDTLGSNEKCELSSDNYYCQKMEKTCSDYKESTCGGKILTSDTKQCIYLGDNVNYNGKEFKCAEYEVDDNCQVKLNEGASYFEKVICTKRDGAQFEEDVYSCKFNNYGFYDSDSCKLEPKDCSKITNVEKCSLGKLSSEFSFCSKVGHSCEEFSISPSCKITEKGACVIKEPVEGQRCEFFQRNACFLFEKGKGCKINPENQQTLFCENGENVPSNKMCYINFDDDSDLSLVKCKLKDIKCEFIYSEDKCTGTNMIIEGKKYYCVWDTDLYNNGGSEDCYQFVYDDYCTRKDKKCVPIEGVTLGENEKCELTIDESTSFLKCRKTFKKGCEEYNDKTECINAPKSNTEQCYYSGGCRRLFIDEKCILNNEGECVENGNGKLASDEICSYMSLIGGGYDLSSCKARKKECYDIKNEQICNNYALEKKNCFVNPNNNQCFELKVEEGCSVFEYGQCVGENCKLDYFKRKCYKVNDTDIEYPDDESDNDNNNGGKKDGKEDDSFYVKFGKILFLSLLMIL
jgi:hypothetical protein